MTQRCTVCDAPATILNTLGEGRCVEHCDIHFQRARERPREPSPARVATALALAQDRVEEVFTAVLGPPNAAKQRHPVVVYDRAKLRELVIDLLELNEDE